MKKSISLEDAIGKSLTGVYHSGDWAILTFGDFFVLLEAAAEGGSTATEIVEVRVCEKNLASLRSDLLGAGVISQEEFDAVWAAQQAQSRQRRADYEQQQYEALKLKFEGPRPLADFRVKPSVNQ